MDSKDLPERYIEEHICIRDYGRDHVIHLDGRKTRPDGGIDVSYSVFKGNEKVGSATDGTLRASEVGMLVSRWWADRNVR